MKEDGRDREGKADTVIVLIKHSYLNIIEHRLRICAFVPDLSEFEY